MDDRQVPPKMLRSAKSFPAGFLQGELVNARKSIYFSPAQTERLKMTTTSPLASPRRLLTSPMLDKAKAKTNHPPCLLGRPLNHGARQLDSAIREGEDIHVRTMSLTSAAVVTEPTTFIFIFTNPKSGNRQGRQLLELGIQYFRLKENPDIQVQIYDVTNLENCAKGLAYLRKLQRRQQEQLVAAAFPEAVRIARHYSQREELVGLQQLEQVLSTGTPHPTDGQGGNNSSSREASPTVSVSTVDNSSDHPRAGSTSPSNAPNCSIRASQPRSQAVSNHSSVDSASSIEEIERRFDAMCTEEAVSRLSTAQESAIKLHAWSAGGDGTVSAVIQLLLDAGLDVNRIYFSCIPFGTGNDFSDVLGWGRSITGQIVDRQASMLSSLIYERLRGYTCKLDVYEVGINTYEGGYVRPVSKHVGSQEARSTSCLMIDYFSLGVQGFVGGSFERNRKKSRLGNIFMYFLMASKWVFLRKFPPLNETLESIDMLPAHIADDPDMTDEDKVEWLLNSRNHERRKIFKFRLAGPNRRKWLRNLSWTKSPSARSEPTDNEQNLGNDNDNYTTSYLNSDPIEVDVQNVARLWGRDIDVWNKTNKQSDSKVKTIGTNNETDSTKWTPQYAGDGKLELFSLDHVLEYAYNQMPNRKDYYVTRLAQTKAPFAMHFRDPSEYPSRGRKHYFGAQTELKPGLLYAMVDGEFYEIYKPKDIYFHRKVTLKAIGSSPDRSKLVRDTINMEGEEATRMPPTMAGFRYTGKEDKGDTNRYLSIPFKRLATTLSSGRSPRIKSISDLFTHQ